MLDGVSECTINKQEGIDKRCIPLRDSVSSDILNHVISKTSRRDVPRKRNAGRGVNGVSTYWSAGHR